ncbi:MAG: hypothetical protein RDU25_02405 [Patescibacteria group bacterium]|nr:hypothetical protein [Patescibacteria group bacterium]
MPIRQSRPSFHDTFPATPSSHLYRNIGISFLVLTILIVVGVLWVSSVRARVTVKVRYDVKQLQGTVEVAKTPEQGQLQGRVVQGNFEKIQEFAVKEGSTLQIPDDVEVRGTAKIINNYSKEQTLVKTTRLLTSDGRLYRIDKTVTVPAGGSVTVAAYSDKKGKEYILSAGTKFTIPGLWIDLQKHIYAEAVSGFSGGEQVAKIVTTLDVSEAQKALEEAVFEQAKKTLRSEAGVSDDWDVIYSKKTVEKKTNVNPGQQSDQFLASVKMDVAAVFYPKQDMEILVRQRLKDGLADGREIVNFDPSLVVYKLDQFDVSSEKAKISIAAQSSTRLTENSPDLSKEAIAGLSIQEAEKKLSDIDGVERVEIQIKPSWIGKLPSMKDKIEMVIQ